MKVKSVVALLIAAVMVLGLAATVFANVNQPWGRNQCENRETCPIGGGLMFNEDGTRLTLAELEARLDELVAAGTITVAERVSFLDRFIFCDGEGLRNCSRNQ